MTAREKISKFASGFTLVELLIVISLLGIIATIVIATINPIEQANRARDTRFKADGSQLISAIDRYFAAHSYFPWVTYGSVADNDAAFGFASAGDPGVGICSASGCTGTGDTYDGLLITTDELKSEFRNRDFIQNTESNDKSKKLFIGKEGGTTSASVYACFIPASKSERDKAVIAHKVYSIDSNTGVRTQTNACDASDANWVTIDCYICIPD